jgi:hypothetical protein
MYKKFSLLFVLMLGILVLSTGCGNSKNSNNSNSSTKDGSKYNNRDNPADIVGIVKSIVGNEAVIAKIDMEKMKQQRQQNMTEEQKEKMKSNLTSQSGARPGGGMGMRMRGGANNDQRDEMSAEMLKNSTGDVKITIPVGISIKKSGQQEGSLVDIKNGVMINIWLNETVTSTKVAKSIILR